MIQVLILLYMVRYCLFTLCFAIHFLILETILRKNLSRNNPCLNKQKSLNTIAMYLVRFYRYAISPLLGANCRFYPSCSSYALLLLRFDNVVIANVKILLRIFRCNPFFHGGFDFPSVYLSQRAFENIKLYQTSLAKPYIKSIPKTTYFFVDSHSCLLKLKKFYIISIHL